MACIPGRPTTLVLGPRHTGNTSARLGDLSQGGAKESRKWPPTAARTARPSPLHPLHRSRCVKLLVGIAKFEDS